VRKGFSIAGRVAYSANMFLKMKTVCLHVIIPEMPSFSMRPAQYFYDSPLPEYLDPKTVLIYRPHPVCHLSDPPCLSFSLVTTFKIFKLLAVNQIARHSS
jgi:hypothetical protein